MIPDRLKPGDEIRIVAPALSASDIDKRVLDRAKAALESLGVSEAVRRTMKRLKICTKRLSVTCRH